MNRKFVKKFGLLFLVFTYFTSSLGGATIERYCSMRHSEAYNAEAASCCRHDPTVTSNDHDEQVMPEKSNECCSETTDRSNQPALHGHTQELNVKQADCCKIHIVYNSQPDLAVFKVFLSKQLQLAAMQVITAVPVYRAITKSVGNISSHPSQQINTPLII